MEKNKTKHNNKKQQKIRRFAWILSKQSIVFITSEIIYETI